ncbi:MULTISPECIES: hypothetical protein [Sphingopyxis]|uniref:hypothetical protein n=1 Tax=Sphingopyxis TaxID=165697 RepID=UPI0015C917D5|nr:MULTISPECIES: hypothetical protein [Sphingopyxis]NYF33691.1 hypothetical protein [Sphingopyxis sp. JAI108]
MPHHALACLLLLLAAAFPRPAEAEKIRTRLAILGVDHSAQLVAEKDQPGMLAAWLDLVKPAAVCIERPPEQASRQDFYEFTYEIQGIILPWAANNPTELCPIDWMPPVDDQLLGFGLDLDTPLEVRKAQGFQGFLTFPDRKILDWDFLSADDPATLAPLQKWAGEPAPRADRDLPRRLYLYRTFMQAQRIRAIAHKRKGETIVVVVGYFHKPDIEAILKHDPAIELVPAASLGRPDDAAVRAATTAEHRGAILAFNLLGMQATTGVVNWGWVERVLTDFTGANASPEARLFQTRYAVLTGKLSLAEAARSYTAIAGDTASTRPFAWTGVKDQARIDSFFDPFGNLDVRQRAQVELARTLFAQRKDARAHQSLDTLAATLSPRKALQLRGYTPLLKPAAPAAKTP